MKNNKISVCIPCYNVEEFIEPLFKCLEAQTFQDFDVVLVNDGSTDKTLEKLNYHKEKSPIKDRISIYSQANVGLAETRNVLIDLSKGDYICFLDSDDIMPNNALEKLYSNCNNGEYDIVVGRAKVIFHEKIKIPFLVQYRFTKEITSHHYVKSNLCTAWGAIFKRSIFDGEKFLKGFAYEDIGLMNFIYLKTNKFKAIKDIVYLYRRRRDSLSNFSYKNRMKIIDIYEQVKQTFNKYQENNWLNDKKYRRLINGTLFQILTANYWLAKHYTNNDSINILPMYSIIDLLNQYHLELKFSKTFWKSLAYFYLRIFYRKINEMVYKKKYIDIFKDTLISEDKIIKNRKNSIVILNNIDDPNVIVNNDKITFFGFDQKLADKYTNLFIGKKINKINESILDLNVNKKIFFIDLRNIKKLNEKDLTIINKINPRLVILFNKEMKNKINLIKPNYIFM